MTFQQRTVKILSSEDGEPVALHDFGGNGPALLLAHGNGLNAGMWAAVLPSLADHFHCFGMDLRGHGAAREVSNGYSVDRDRFGEDVLACVDAIGGPVRVAAHSLGGAATVYAALARPEAFTRLWLYEPVLVPVGFKRDKEAGPSMLVEISRRRRMEFDSVDEAVDRLSSKLPFLGCDSRSVRGYLEIGTYPIEGGVHLACTGDNEARVFGTNVDLDFGRLNALTMPTVVASGGDPDTANAMPPKLASRVAEAMGNAVWEQHRSLSHFGPMEAPHDIAQSIIAHLG